MSSMIEKDLDHQKEEEKRDLYPYDLGVARYREFQLLDFSTSGCPHLSFWLQHGLIWYYGFNHEAAIACFQEATRISEECVAAHWGLSLCHGPNYNTASMTRDSFPSAREAYMHAQRAMELLKREDIRNKLTDVELAIFSSLENRFNPVDETTPPDSIPQNTQAYSDALHGVYEEFSAHACAAALYAESLMQFDPWRLWDLETGTPSVWASRAKEVLLNASESNSNNTNTNFKGT